MTLREWVMVAALVAATALVGLGWAAFWPAWPPEDPPPRKARRPRRYRRRHEMAEAERLDGDEVPLPPERLDLAGPLPLGPSAEEWMWTTGEHRRPMHRYEHVGQETQALRPPPPEWPPRRPIE